GFFHGRETESDELLRQKALTILFGQSGLGKSSLLQAGLFPRLRAENFRPVVMRLSFGKSSQGSLSPGEQVRPALNLDLFEAGKGLPGRYGKNGKRHHRVIPVLVDDGSMARASDLPDDLKALVRRNAVEVSHTRFSADSERLIVALERIFEKTTAEQQKREEK